MSRYKINALLEESFSNGNVLNESFSSDIIRQYLPKSVLSYHISWDKIKDSDFTKIYSDYEILSKIFSHTSHELVNIFRQGILFLIQDNQRIYMIAFGATLHSNIFNDNAQAINYIKDHPNTCTAYYITDLYTKFPVPLREKTHNLNFTINTLDGPIKAETLYYRIINSIPELNYTFVNFDNRFNIEKLYNYCIKATKSANDKIFIKINKKNLLLSEILTLYKNALIGNDSELGILELYKNAYENIINNEKEVLKRCICREDKNSNRKIDNLIKDYKEHTYEHLHINDYILKEDMTYVFAEPFIKFACKLKHIVDNSNRGIRASERGKIRDALSNLERPLIEIKAYRDYLSERY